MIYIKKLISILVVLALVISTLATVNVSAAAKSTLSATKKVIQVGSTTKLTISNPEKGASYSWTSSNKNIATVNNGEVKGIKKGNAVISCEVKKGGNKYILNCNIDVTNKLTNLENLSPTAVNKYEGNMGDSFWKILGSRNGKTDTNGKIYSNGVEIWLARWNYKTEKSFVTSEIDLDGQYSNLSGKIVVLKASYNNSDFDTTFKVIGDEKVLFTYKMTPKTMGKDVNINVEGVKKLTISVYDNKEVKGGTSFGFVNSTLESSSNAFPILETEKCALDIGNTINLALKYKVNNASYRWYSDNESIATVDNNGKVTAVGSGTTQVNCEITKPDKQKKVLKCEVKVNREGVYIETLTPSATDRYTGNQGDSFMSKLGTRNGTINVNGKKYTHGLEAWIARWNYKNEISWVYNEYIIDKKFSGLVGEISVLKDSWNNDDFNTTVEIIGDGVVLDSYIVTADILPIFVNVNLTNVSTVRISVKDNIAVSGGTSFALGDFKFVK